MTRFCAETLLCQDQRICNSLEEKLQLYAELTELTLHSPEPVLHRHLLVQPDSDSEIPPQASTLLTAALREGKRGCAVSPRRHFEKAHPMSHVIPS